jgi:hypothetical protein
MCSFHEFLLEFKLQLAPIRCPSPDKLKLELQRRKSSVHGGGKSGGFQRDF